MNPKDPSETTGDGEPKASKRGLLRPLALAAALVTLLILGRALGLDAALGEADTWIREFGPWGPLVFAALTVVHPLLLLDEMKTLQRRRRADGRP